MSNNPYAPPSTVESVERVRSSRRVELAGRLSRFVAAMIDGVLLVAVLLPIQIFTGFLDPARIEQAGVLERLGMSALGLSVFLLLHGYLLYSRGQTIGKMICQIQIVDSESAKLLNFFRVYVLRCLWSVPFVIIFALIPGTSDDLIVNALVLIDVLLIFGASCRCLHDYIAGSIVVIYHESRRRGT